MSDKQPETVTSWRQGEFLEATKPSWWDEALGLLWRSQSEASGTLVETFGLKDIQAVEVYRLTQGRGYLVEFCHLDLIIQVWIRSDADLMQALTTRVPAWLALPGNGEDSLLGVLRDIRNTAIGYARHGQGEHIDPDGHPNQRDERDRAQEALARRREAAAAAQKEGGT